MSPILVICILFVYFLVVLLIANYTGRGASNKDFFKAGGNASWYLVAFGMIGASLSGVTFISIPGAVGTMQFSYMQVVLGYLVGYFIIATVLMPIYYKLNLLSIYQYLEARFGFWSYKTGASFFLLSRTIGAAFRLFLVAGVLQAFVFAAWDVPFEITTLITIALVWLYTFRGGIKTIVWTDALQTFFMVLAILMSIIFINDALELSFSESVLAIWQSEHSQIFFWDWQSPKNFFKQFIAGAFIALTMTGLDQDMMQKNLACRTLGESQKNMFWFSLILVFINLMFLCFGALLFLYVASQGISLPERSDDLYPIIARDYLSISAAITFLIGITAAAYSSADSALTALTTSFCVDFLGIARTKDSEKEVQNTRIKVHIGFSLLLFFVILFFYYLNDRSVIDALFVAAGYTYGPLLGLYAFGILTKRKVLDKYVPWIAIASPVLCFFIAQNSEAWLAGYKFGYELILLNGLLTFIGLAAISRR
ncbi:MAG: sodium:solute symporter [Bernardetiaceae bacterium]|nr:sodium:solute symporter [Bernardetiaceae bacterium]